MPFLLTKNYIYLYCSLQKPTVKWCTFLKNLQIILLPEDHDDNDEKERSRFLCTMKMT